MVYTYDEDGKRQAEVAHTTSRPFSSPLFQPIEKMMYGMDSVQFTSVSSQAMGSVNAPDLIQSNFRFSTLLYGSKGGSGSFNHFLIEKNIRNEFVRCYKPQTRKQVEYMKIYFQDYFVKIGLAAPFAMTVRFCINKYMNHTRHNLILHSMTVKDLYEALKTISKSVLSLIDEYRNTISSESDKDLFDKELGRWQVCNFSINRLDFTYDLYFKESEYKQQFLKQMSNVRIPDYSCGNIDDVSITFLPQSKQQEKSIPRIKIYDKQGDIIKHYPQCEDAIKQSKNVVRFEFQLHRKAIRKKFGGLSYDEFISKINVNEVFHQYFKTLFTSFYAPASLGDEKEIKQFINSFKYFQAFSISRSVPGTCDLLNAKPPTVRKHLRILAGLGLVRGNSKWDWAQLTDAGIQLSENLINEGEELGHIDVLPIIFKYIQAKQSRMVQRQQTILNSPARLFSYDAIISDNLLSNALYSNGIDQSRIHRCNSSVTSSCNDSHSFNEKILQWLKNHPDGVPIWDVIEQFGKKSEAVLDKLLHDGDIFEPNPGVLRAM